jgi:hypothetical protein
VEKKMKHLIFLLFSSTLLYTFSLIPQELLNEINHLHQGLYLDPNHQDKQLMYFPDHTTPPTEYNYIPKKPGHYSIQDWQAIIDSTWGQGLPTQTKLALFQEAWNSFDADYACFQNLEVNWDSLYQLYYSEIDSGVSQGRFAAIMNYLGLALLETHSYVYNRTVSINTPRNPGIPLFVFGTPGNITHFGAGLSPLPDSSLLVFKTLPNHPLNLVPGDVVLGYDGIPWKDLYKELLNAQLPYSPTSFYVSTETAMNHLYLVSAGMNWHLFDTLDVVKYATGDTVHFHTAPLAGQTGFIWGNEQLPVPGVPWLNVPPGIIQWPSQLGDYVSWGIIDGTQIGYIYVAELTASPGVEFFQAVDSLMNHYETTGIILDIRVNYGGTFGSDKQALSLLFNSDVYTVAYDQRGPDPNNHFQMIPLFSSGYSAIPGDPQTFYDRPIAVLTGPGAISLGDVLALKMKYHPMSRLFGKPTSGAFSSWNGVINLMGNTNWQFAVTTGNAYLVSNPGNYLAHTELAVDEEVWFTQEDVANGDDTVVKAALKWINSMIYAHKVNSNSAFIRPTIDTLNITAHVTNPQNHNLQVAAIINTIDTVFIDSLPMFDDGNHGDSLAGDGIYGCYSNIITEENVYSIDASVTDLDSNHYHILTNADRFATAGPVVVDHHDIPNQYPHLNIFHLKLYLRNDGLATTATEISAELSTSDTNVTSIAPVSISYGNIDPGQIKDTSGAFYIHIQNDPQTIDFEVSISSENWSFWRDSIKVVLDSTILGIHTSSNIPRVFALFQNYPNPFNPSTTIEFDLPKTSEVTLKVFNILGEEVATLISERLSASSYSYEWDASGLASGVYLYKIETDLYLDIKKMILLK